MAVTAGALLRLSLTVSRLETLAAFYETALGFHAPDGAVGDPALAALLGADAARRLILRRGAQHLELVQLTPPGRPYPTLQAANDPLFQHAALVTADIEAAYARLAPHAHTAISRNGPSRLPGGITAYKFRDPDGHPLELIQFPVPNPATANGIDHTAISVADAGRAIAFYEALGLACTARQRNTGPAQDALDGLRDTSVEVVAMCPPSPAPHLELLAYRTALVSGAVPRAAPRDLAASRTVFAAGGQPVLRHDPDGHALLFV